MQHVRVAGTTIEVVNQGLLDTFAEAAIISANNGLRASQTRWSWAQEAERRAGPLYVSECQRLASAAGPKGLPQGTATVTHAGLLRNTGTRLLIQAVTIAYHGGKRVPATSDIVHQATRAALEKAELYRVRSVAAYPMTLSPGYNLDPAPDVVRAMLEAILQHAVITGCIGHFAICETDQSKLNLAMETLGTLVNG